MKMRMIVTFLLVAAVCIAAAGAFKFKPDPKDTSPDDTTGDDTRRVLTIMTTTKRTEDTTRTRDTKHDAY